ncbi:hypothetical protein JQ760_028595 (plasmid) [Klebsiella pneumoniae]|uniref:hypothetical protein n=1 Tax=Klebsiella pneumoniae TaxID=573 RepID=UPI001FAE3BD4|nr:hypothetical protein [Klebsiella pneumoniae]MCI8109339.1 hypothetical protein [Klebsiella pneumoniae]
MGEGMFGLPIKPPGALYWFNVSLLFLVMTSFYALASGSFPGMFVIVALGLMGVAGMKRPFVSAQQIIRSKEGFLTYALCMLSMCNLLDHILHKPVSLPGVMSVILSGIIGFSLGRYASIGRFGLEKPPADKEGREKIETSTHE